MDCNRGVLIYPDSPALAEMRKKLSLGMFQHAMLYRLWYDWTNEERLRPCPHVEIPDITLPVPPVMWIVGLGSTPN
jgi:hypothetical protein